MSWIKRNLFFVIGSVVALGLLVGAGFYNYVGWQRNAEARGQLNAAYDKLRELNNKEPNPGDGKKVDNIKLAREQQGEIRSVLTNAARHFQPIPPIPDSPRMNDKDFTAALAQTVERLQNQAAAANVALPPNYYFSFQAQSQSMTFAPGSLGPLSVKLGEVAAICEDLFQAKINALDYIQRERVSADDLTKGSPTDFLDQQSQRNDLAVLTPYEVTFRCFSSELAAVLSSFANSPHGFVVKGINVEPVVPTGVSEGLGAERMGMPGTAGGRSIADEAAVRAGFTAPGYAQAPAPTPVTAPAGRGVLTVVLDEKQLKITMLLEVVKLLPRK